MRIGVLRTLPSAHLARLVEALQRAMPGTAVELCDGTRDELDEKLASRRVAACISSAGRARAGRASTVLVREDYGLVVGLRHRFSTSDSVGLEELRDEAFIVRTHCETFAGTTKLLLDRGIRTRVVYRTDKRVAVRGFDAERVFELHWDDGADDARLDTLIAFAGSMNWRPSPWTRPVDVRLHAADAALERA